MIEDIHSKTFVAGMIELISQGIHRGRHDDAELLLAAVRDLRPKLPELDTFDAWIAVGRGQWKDAIRTLRNSEANGETWPLGQALLAFCQYATGDQDWAISANEVLTTTASPEAASLVRLLLGQDDSPAEAESTTTTTATDYSQHAYMRA